MFQIRRFIMINNIIIPNILTRSFSIFDQEKRTNLMKKHTKVSRDHLTPEIPLHLICESSPIFYATPNQLPDLDFPFSDPYWGFYWPGGQALTRWILDNPDYFTGKCIVDFGCGCGASTVAALKAGAKTVLALDIDEDALLATQINLHLNNVDFINKVDFVSTNLLGESLDDCWSILLVGDMFYSDELANEIYAWFTALQKCRADRSMLIGDPGRYQFSHSKAIQNLEKLSSYSFPSYALLENSLQSADVYLANKNAKLS